MDSILTSENASLITLVAVVLWALLQMLWRIKDRAHEEGDQYEPKASPPLHKEYAPREEITRLDGRINKLDEKFTAEFSNQRQSGSESRQKLYESIRTIEQNVSALQASDKIRSQQTHEIQQDIKSILGKIGGAK